MSIVNKARNLFSLKHAYNAGKEKIVAIVFIILVAIVLQFPNVFSRSVNSVVGKIIMLILIISLTSYNVIAGLFATFIMMGYYTYLNEHGYYEGLEGMPPSTTTKPKSTPPTTQTNPVAPTTLPTTPPVDLIQASVNVQPKSSVSLPIISPQNSANVSPSPSSKEAFKSSMASVSEQSM